MVSVDGVHNDDRFSSSGLTHNRQRACRVDDSNRSMLDINLIFLQKIHPVGIIPYVVGDIAVDRRFEYAGSAIDYYVVSPGAPNERLAASKRIIEQSENFVFIFDPMRLQILSSRNSVDFPAGSIGWNRIYSYILP